MIALIENHLETLQESCKKHHVKRLFLFGSAARENFDPENSDLDLVVEFFEDLAPEDYADNYFSLLEELQNLFGKKVELLSAKALKNPVMIREIEESKVPLYAA